MSEEIRSGMLPGARREVSASGKFSNSLNPGMKPQQQVERDSGRISAIKSHQIERDSGRPTHQGKGYLMSPAPAYNREDSGISNDSLPSLSSPTPSYLKPPAYNRADSGISTNSLSSLPSPDPSASIVSRGSIDSGYGYSMASLSLHPLSPSVDQQFSLSSHQEDGSLIGGSSDEVDYHDHDRTVTEEEGNDKEETRGDGELMDNEEAENTDATPTNSPSNTKELLWIENKPLPVDIPATYDYQLYLKSFFRLFVDGLSLRKDTAYDAFRSEDVDALGFGIKRDRVVPCLKIYTSLPQTKWPSLQEEVVRHLMDAVTKANLQTDDDDYHSIMNYIEFDNTVNSVFHPEDLMSSSSPGDQFRIPEEALKGTIGYYIKGKLKVFNADTATSHEKHFAVTCAHCVVPTHLMWSVISDADEHKMIKTLCENYPINLLYNHMWEDNGHSSFFKRILDHLKHHAADMSNGGPLQYSGYKHKEKLCFIKASICPRGMREVLKDKIRYVEGTSSQPSYEYVLSKFGMIPENFTTPLIPGYILQDDGSPCCRDNCRRGDGKAAYNFPFNVDVGILEVKEPCKRHSLCSALEKTSALVSVSSFDEDDPDHPVKKEAFKYEKKSHQQFAGPTSGHTNHPTCSQSHDQKPVSRDQRPVSHDGVTPCRGQSAHPHCLNQFPPHACDKCQTLTSKSEQEHALIATEKRRECKEEVKDRLRQAASTAVASGINLFSDREEKHLKLQVLSSQKGRNGKDRPHRRTMTIKNNQFCLEFVHRNPKNRSQVRSFPTIKWKPSLDQNDFIIQGDSGSSLFLVHTDPTTEQDQLVLLGIAGSASTGTRVDFIRKVISPDLCHYMISELLKDTSLDQNLRYACEIFQGHLAIGKQLQRLSEKHNKKDLHQQIREIQDNLQKKSYTCSMSGSEVEFEITECIKECI